MPNDPLPLPPLSSSPDEVAAQGHGRPAGTDVGAEGISEEQVEGVLKLVDMLEEDGDVVKVWTNLAED